MKHLSVHCWAWSVLFLLDHSNLPTMTSFFIYLLKHNVPFNVMKCQDISSLLELMILKKKKIQAAFCNFSVLKMSNLRTRDSFHKCWRNRPLVSDYIRFLTASRATPESTEWAVAVETIARDAVMENYPPSNQSEFSRAVGQRSHFSVLKLAQWWRETVLELLYL